MLMSACQLVAKSHTADHLILQKENVFVQLLGWPSAGQHVHSIALKSLHLIFTLYMYIYIYVSFYAQLFCHSTEPRSLLK